MCVLYFQDDNWGETATALTARTTTSVDYGPIDPMSKYLVSTERGMRFRLKRHFSTLVWGLISTLAIASPILMLALPTSGVLDLREHQLNCDVQCDGAIVAVAFKLVIVVIGAWAIFVRPSRASLPRMQFYRVLVGVFVIVVLVSFWLFS